MSKPSTIYKSIKRTIYALLQTLPYKKGDVVRTNYTEPPSDRKIEELEISSNCSSGVRVQLGGVRTATGTELWLDSGWIEPIPLPYKVGDLVNFTGSKYPQQLKIETIAREDDDVVITFVGKNYLADSSMVSPIDKGCQVKQYVPEPGDIVNYVGGMRPQQLEVEAKVFTPDGWKIKFVGQSYSADLAYVFPIKKEEEPRAMTDIKWIPVDPDNLPEGEVLAISKNRLRPVIGRIRIHEYEGIYCLDGEGHSITPVAYLLLDDLHKTWEAQNLAAGYSKDSEAFKLLEWIIESDSSLGKALGEIPLEAGHTIDILAQQIIKISKLVPKAPSSPHANSDDFLEELIFWIKDYISD